MRSMRSERPPKSRGFVKTPDPKFGNDQLCDMVNFDETSRRIQWSKNEFSHRLALETILIHRDALGGLPSSSPLAGCQVRDFNTFDEKAAVNRTHSMRFATF
jgi:hypothetical protein